MVFKKGERSAFAGRKHTKKTRARIALAMHGYSRSHNEETKSQISKQTKLAMGQLSKDSKKRLIEGARKSGLANRGRIISEEGRRNMSIGQLGKKRSPHSEQTRQKMSKSRTDWLVKQGFPWPPTDLEFALDLLLQDAGLEYEAQRRFGNRLVDAYVSSHNLVFEADGAYWHRYKRKEILRDTEIKEAGVLEIVHLDEHDLAPWTIKDGGQD